MHQMEGVEEDAIFVANLKEVNFEKRNEGI